MSHRLLELFYVADIDYSWVAKFLSLLLLPAAHEDVAIILGGYLVVNQLMPVGIVVVTIYFGMVASDLALYGIGAGARRLPWLSRLAVNERVKNFGDTLQRNLFGLAALGRVVPGRDLRDHDRLRLDARAAGPASRWRACCRRRSICR